MVPPTSLKKPQLIAWRAEISLSCGALPKHRFVSRTNDVFFKPLKIGVVSYAAKVIRTSTLHEAPDLGN